MQSPSGPDQFAVAFDNDDDGGDDAGTRAALLTATADGELLAQVIRTG